MTIEFISIRASATTQEEKDILTLIEMASEYYDYHLSIGEHSTAMQFKERIEDYSKQARELAATN